MLKHTNGATSTVVAKINDVSIIIIEDGRGKNVPIRPICDILGIDHKTQIDKIKEDEILSSTGGLNPAVGADGKPREMFTIPLKYVFGWLFTINPKNVNPEAKEAVIKYKEACYDALYSHFVKYKDFVEKKQNEIEALLERREKARASFKDARNILSEIEREIKIARSMTFQNWIEYNMVQKLPFPEESINN